MLITWQSGYIKCSDVWKENMEKEAQIKQSASKYCFLSPFSYAPIIKLSTTWSYFLLFMSMDYPHFPVNNFSDTVNFCLCSFFFFLILEVMVVMTISIFKHPPHAHPWMAAWRISNFFQLILYNKSVFPLFERWFLEPFAYKQE